MNKNEFVRAIANKAGITLKEAATALDSVVAAITEGLKNGEKIQISGFGTFEVMLTDGEKRGLPLTMDAGKRLLKYRYGRDGKPGQANVDDNLTVTQ